MKSDTVWTCVCIFLLLLDEETSSWNGSSALTVPFSNEVPGSPNMRSAREAEPQWMDCIQASDKCNQDSNCSPQYRVMRQCLVGKEKEAMLDNNKECQAALEVLMSSPLYRCRCRRGMKKEVLCLQNYWTIHMGLNEGRDMENSSPYEPVAPNRHPDVFRLAAISSGMLTAPPKGFQCPDAERNCNPCIDAAKACNLNGVCKKHRTNYIATCEKRDSVKGETCNKKRCHKILRTFLDRVPSEFSYGLLFCPCQTEACAERRRQTIVPDCSYKDKEKPNCLELQRICQQDTLCRSRLVDYVDNCWMPPHTMSTCPNQDNHQACLASYARLIGTEMTPNYVDSSVSNWTISPWCTCKGSGNQEGECMNFQRYFTNNTCLRNAIQAFGYEMYSTQNKTVTVPSTSATAKLEPSFAITKETQSPSLAELDMYTTLHNRALDLGEDHSPCLCASVWVLLPSLALALILAQHAL